ncbi:GNAT family N-acetyltransferase [Taibaiella sp. KBW10]|uniref:GNAT family N-acetyltransferase n=1 Tax=Taibaiella sp. KBW10 TaxID=2153357 RepID=UPI000F5B2A78|nr:GNAT family N-acetyltransferase [Taibaiella sp. KBW10]RQO30429.1 GNAT family N-acetyltransferase [Taibaiella sp. KBW10]
MNYSIRPIAATDNVALSRLIKSIFEAFDLALPGTVYSDPTTDTLFEVFQQEGAAYWVAAEEDTILGGCGLFPTPGLPEGYAELVKFYLSPEARGKGIGSRLLEQTIDTARTIGYTHLYLESFDAFEMAVNLYQRHHFKALDKALGNSGHYACTIWMLKDL